MQSKLLRGLGTRTRLPRLALSCLIIIHKLIVASCDCLKHGHSAFLFSRWMRKPGFFKKKTICSSGGESTGGRSQCLSARLRSNTNRPFLPVRPQEVEREWPRVLWAHRFFSTCQPAGSWPQTPHPTDSQYMPFVFRYTSGKMLPVCCWILLRK